MSRMSLGSFEIATLGAGAPLELVLADWYIGYDNIALIDKITPTVLSAFTIDKMLVTIDISTPTSPVILDAFDDGGSGTYQAEESTTYGDVLIKVSGVSGNNGTLELFDLSNPSNIQEYSTTTPASARFVSVAVDSSGNYAYVSDAYQSSIRVYDISNRSSPSLVTSIGSALDFPTLSNHCWSIVEGSYLYVGSYLRMSIYNISTPSAPTFVSTLNDNNLYQIRKPYYHNGWIFGINNLIHDLVPINVSNPSSPSVGSILVSVNFNAFSTPVVTDSNWLITGGNDIISAIDVTDPSSSMSITHTLSDPITGDNQRSIWMGSSKDYIVNVSNQETPFVENGGSINIYTTGL